MIACKLICGDVIDAMKTLEDDSIDLIVTSFDRDITPLWGW